MTNFNILVSAGFNSTDYFGVIILLLKFLEMIALRLKIQQMKDMLAAAKAKPAESPVRKALRLEAEALERQDAALQGGITHVIIRGEG
jgi:hypothetical protein